jgi:hypothetical protein
VSTERAGVDDPPPAGAVQRTGGTGRGVAVVRSLPESLRNGPGICGEYQKAITLLEGKIRRGASANDRRESGLAAVAGFVSRRTAHLLVSATSSGHTLPAVALHHELADEGPTVVLVHERQVTAVCGTRSGILLSPATGRFDSNCRASATRH